MGNDVVEFFLIFMLLTGHKIDLSFKLFLNGRETISIKKSPS